MRWIVLGRAIETEANATYKGQTFREQCGQGKHTRGEVEMRGCVGDGLERGKGKGKGKGWCWVICQK